MYNIALHVQYWVVLIYNADGVHTADAPIEERERVWKEIVFEQHVVCSVCVCACVRVCCVCACVRACVCVCVCVYITAYALLSGCFTVL